MRCLFTCLACYFFSFIPVWGMMITDTNKNILVAIEKGSNKIWYQSLHGKDQLWHLAEGLIKTDKAGFNSVIYARNKFIAIADYATIWYSENGKQWKKITEKLTGQTTFNAILDTKNMLMVVGNGWKGSIWTSNDGLHWINRVKRLNHLDLKALSYDGNNKIVAVGSNGKIVYSKDAGTTLHSIYVSPGPNFLDVTYGQGRFVAIASNKIYTSIDGERWECNLNTTINLNAVSYIPAYRLFIVLCDGRVGYSANGIAWTFLGSNYNTIIHLADLKHFASGKLNNDVITFAFGKKHHDSHDIIVSTRDGIHWEDQRDDDLYASIDSITQREDHHFYLLENPIQNFNTYSSEDRYKWLKSGKLKALGKFLREEIFNVGGIAISPNNKYIYMTSVFPLKDGYISWYLINTNGSLSYNYQGRIQIRNYFPKGIVISPDGNNVYVAMDRYCIKRCDYDFS
jgi:hypothetical protein